MKQKIKSFLRRLHRDENAQVLPMVAVMMIGFLGMAAMVADMGDVFYAYNELQGSTQAAALAAAEAISNPSFTTPGGTYPETPQAFAVYYGSETGTGANGINTHSILTSTGTNVSTTPYFSCNSFVSSLGISCITYNGSGTTTANAVQVVQVATVKTYFAALFGTPSVTLTSTASAARAGVFAPYNVAVIIDTTESMDTSDTNCPSGTTTTRGKTTTTYYTRLGCALQGIQVLLQDLAPCYANETCTAVSGETGVVNNSVDRVALFTFPNILTTTVSDDYTNCDATNPTIEPYSFPSSSISSSSTYSAVSQTYYATPTTNGAVPAQLGTTTYPTTYEVTYGLGDADGNGYVSDYKTSDATTTLNSASDLVLAIGGKSGCAGVGDPGGAGTYYAGVIYAAAASLAAEQKVNNVPNVIILVSDGDASSTGAGTWTTTCTSGSTSCAPTSCNGNTKCTSAGLTWNCGTKSGSAYTCTSPDANKMGGASLTSGTYPSVVDECGQAITAANSAVTSGVVSRIYTVAYGSESSGCSTDGSGTYSTQGTTFTGVPNPCTTMQYIASNSNYFYNDPDQSGSGLANCSGAVESGGLAAIFQYIAADLSRSRLIPNSEFPTPSS
jgi:hypothetical protein